MLGRRVVLIVVPSVAERRRGKAKYRVKVLKVAIIENREIDVIIK